MSPNIFWKLIGGLALAFLVPWLFLVVVPFVSMSNAAPIEYVEEDGVEGGIVEYPTPSMQKVGAGDYGRQVYAAEGCAYCHTQMVRPTYAGPDMWRPGWGGREDEGLARETRPQDYVTETYAPLGYQRIGQDLSNVGHRITDRELMHRHLFDPKSIDVDSGMPAYRHLYKKSPYGKGWIPKDDGRADALVDYLLSLKKDQQLPSKMTAGQ